MTCLWIVVARRLYASRALVPILAHELQHAVEALESAAITSADLEALFKQASTSHGRVHETDAAQRMQRRVEAELRRD